MTRAATLLAALVFVGMALTVDAQTLDELQHPLVAKGQLTAVAEYEIYAVEHTVGALGSTWTMTYLQPQQVVVPQLRIGLANRLEMRVEGVNQFPTPFSDPGFAAFTRGGHALYTSGIRTVGTTVLFRPSQGLELRGFYRWGRSRDNLNYTSGSGPVDEIYQSETVTTHVMSFAGTWLSTPGGSNGSLRANLDGLQHPLLAARHWMVDGELMGRLYDYGYRSTGDPSNDIVEAMASTDTRLRLGVRCGLPGRAEFRADGYWHPQFTMSDATQVTSRWLGRTIATTVVSPTRYQGVYGWRFGGTWRPTQRVEAFVQGSREQQGVAQDSPGRSGPVERIKTTTVQLGGSWLSGGPTRSAILAPDLAGLYHPLVEPKQIKIDGAVNYFAYRGDRFVPEAWLWRARATTGIWPWLQASVSGGHVSVKRFAVWNRARVSFDRYVMLSGDVVLRVFGRAEAYASADLHSPGAFDVYPVFILGRDDPYHKFHDVLSNDFGGDRTFHAGLRLVF